MFFFFKQKTAYEIYQCDWSSDVCSSDLNYLVEFGPRHVGIQGHPEFRPTFAEAIYRSYRDRRGSLADDALASLDRPTDTPIVVDWMLNVLESS